MEGRSFSIYTYSKFRKKYLMAWSPGKNNWRHESRKKNICVADENTRPTPDIKWSLPYAAFTREKNGPRMGKIQSQLEK